jgi:hypothetical protein
MFLFLLQGLEKVWMFDACSVELYDAGDTFGIVPAQSRVADLAVDLFDALIVGPTMDRSAGRGEAQQVGGMAEPEGFEPSIGLYNPITV